MVWKLAKAGHDPAVAFAAEELKRVLRRMDPDLEVAILRYPAFDPALSDVLWLGVCPCVAELVTEPLFDDAVDIRVKNGRGAIRGSNPRSVLLGVYRFLRALGCAWVRPGQSGEIIPQRCLCEVDVELSEIPSYRHRAVCIEGAVNYDHVADMIDWMPKMGLNGYFNQFAVPFTFYDRWYSHQENPLLTAEPLSSAEVRGIRDQSVAEMKKRGLMYHVAGHGWTCEPFGIPGETWDKREYDISEQQRSWMAQVGGKRDLWHGVPLNTNLCYSNPEVRGRMAEAIAGYCKAIPEVDFLHVWLADGTNNHCECEHCLEKIPADWYMQLMNEIDARLSAEGLPTKIVFLVYVDLLWPPEVVRLINPDRFVLMFAPITRTYTTSLADAGVFDEEKLPPYARNQLQFPKSVEENLAWLRRWRKTFAGDSFDFDYHFMWDHFRDPGYVRMAEVLFRDMQNLHKVGLNGMVSCQNQRVFFPSGLGMTAMAAGLWDEKADFGQVAAEFFRAAFGSDGDQVREYLTALSDAFDPPYLRGERPAVDAAEAARFAAIPALIRKYETLIDENADLWRLPDNVQLSWVYLRHHARLCLLMAKALEYKAKGEFDAALAVLQDVTSYARQNEAFLAPVFDVFEFQRTFQQIVKAGMPK